MPAPRSESERQRIQELISYQVLDTPYEKSFNRIVEAAADIMQTPIALISLIDSDRQWFKAEVGLGVEQTPRHDALCDYVVAYQKMLVVEDARLDPKFANNDFVQGGPCVIAYMGAPLVTPSGQVLGSLCVIDNTRPRQFSAAEQRVLETLAQSVMAQLEVRRNRHLADQAKLLHTISRQLRTPLTAIIGHAELLAEDATKAPTLNLHEDINPIQHAGQRLLQFTDHLFELSQISNSIGPPTVVHLSPLIRELYLEYSDDAKRKNNTIFLGKIEASVVTNREHLFYVLNHVMHNANRFTTNGQIIIQVSTREHHVQISITDTGPGIHQDQLKHLFGYFDPKELTPHDKDAGFGLSLCKQLCTMMNAELTIMSTPSKGTQVLLQLPSS